MGSQTILDLIGSTVVFSLLLLIALRINVSNSENMQMYRGDVLVQENLVEIVKLLEMDFRRIGYCRDINAIPDPRTAIQYASDTAITFLTDFPVDTTADGWLGDGTIDQLTYYVGSPTDAGVVDTPNPNDRLLYRVENSDTPQGVNLGVTIFNLRYLDALKQPLSSPVTLPQQIQYMEITIKVENLTKMTNVVNVAAYDTNYQSAYWRQFRLVAKNLRNR